MLRVRLEIEAQSRHDLGGGRATRCPAGATHARHRPRRATRSIATRGEQRRRARVWPAFEERAFEAFRAYYELRARRGAVPSSTRCA
ncbi:MAG: hypothetical protein MZV65_37470 [Chromatiales bacterium]|nr:hypothetical protein [Chromatiales bacterium]